MSMLLLDVGNTRVKWAVMQSGVLAPAQALPHGGEPPSVVASIVAAEVDAIRVANVTGAQHAAALTDALQTKFACIPEFAASETERCGLRSGYAEPQRLGIDRWLGLLAAWSRVRGAACVVSCGTALTFDAIDARGQHLGGIIAPGLLTAQKAVLGATRFAASGPDQSYSEGLGQNTEACVRQGALHACAGLVERLAARYPDAVLLLTGGDADLLCAHLDGPWIVAPDLVIEGLLAL
jgi:type III pantothenate kinase